MKATLIGAAALLAVPFAPAAAQAPGSRQTREFVQQAGESDAFEVMEAYTALAESHDPQVLGFARRMIQDHGNTSLTLQQATARAGLEPPPKGLGAAQAPFLAALQSARGGEFDRMYWHQQALAHRSALVVEQRYAADGDTAAVRQVAAAAVPIIQAHLAMAEQMDGAADKP